VKREDIQRKIDQIESELARGRWAASGELALRETAAQLEIALALTRLADAMETNNGKGN
jgi:hypothetical protein